MLPIFRRPTVSSVYSQLTPLVKNKKSASYFTITLSLFSLSFFGMLAIRPTLITVFSLQKSVNELKKLNRSYENKISAIVHAQSEYEQIRDSISTIEEAIPEKALFNKLAYKLETFAKKSDLTINQMQIDNVPISKPQASTKLLKYNFSLIAIGDYPSIISYLNHLLNWKRILNINSLDFSSEGTTSSGNLRITLKGSAFYEP